MEQLGASTGACAAVEIKASRCRGSWRGGLPRQWPAAASGTDRTSYMKTPDTSDTVRVSDTLRRTPPQVRAPCTVIYAFTPDPFVSVGPLAFGMGPDETS